MDRLSLIEVSGDWSYLFRIILMERLWKVERLRGDLLKLNHG
jgi:hypothetical protein